MKSRSVLLSDELKPISEMASRDRGEHLVLRHYFMELLGASSIKPFAVNSPMLHLPQS
jgi:hypothetical protein